MTLTTFLIAVLGLLLTPGPTNTLMAVAGAERGARRALRLIPAELAGYLTTVLPLALAGAVWLEHMPAARPAIAAAAAVWVMLLAVQVWRLPAQDGTNAGVSVTAGRIFLTTLLNPKALIFGLVLLPPRAGLELRLAGFAVLVVAVALVWIGLGTLLRRTGQDHAPGLSPGLRRAAAGWLAVLSVMLAAKAVAG